MFKKLVYGVLILVVLSSILSACSQGQQTDPAINNLSKNADGYTDITVQQLNTMMETDDFTFVNVHIPYQGEIPQTDLFIPFDQIASSLDQLPAEKDAQIVLYCRSGSMSTTAAKTLAELGYTNVFEVDGGFNAWQAAGFELINK